MDRWKERWSRRIEKRREEERSEKRKSQKKEEAVARKGRKVAKHCVFPMICGSGGSKSRLAKAAGAEPADQMRDEKLHTVVARSTFRSQNVQNTPCSDHFWKLRRRKSVRRCGAKHISKLKCEKHQGFGPLLDVQMSFRVAGTRDCGPCQKWAKRQGFVAFPKTMAGVGHLKRICKDAISVAGAVQETCSSELLGGPGADFLRWVAFWSIRSSVLGTWFCVTGGSISGGRRSSLDRWTGKIAKRIGTRPSALHSTFHVWRKSRRIVSFLMLSASKIEEVSQNCFVLMLSSSKIEKVSQNCLVFGVVKFKNWGSLAELLSFQACR